MDLEFTPGLMTESILGSGNQIKCMGKEPLLGKMVGNILEK
jgi:hypothetical protein